MSRSKRQRMSLHVASVLALTLSAPVLGSLANSQKPLIDVSKSKSGNPFTEEFAEFAKKQLEDWKVPGVSIAVIDDDEIYAEGYGFATLPDTKATPETLWYGASTTKAQAAALLSHLIDSKEYPELKDGWSTTISSIIRDDFIVQDEWATTHLTLDDAVSHRSGLGAYGLASFREVDGKQVLPKDVVRSLRHLPLVNPPRAAWEYSNHMFTTLGHVIETVTGKWLGEVLKKNLWGPLGMNSTYFDLEEAQDAPEHFAAGYFWDKNKKEYAHVPYMTVTDVGAAGAAISNVLDYAKWVKSLLHEAAPLSKWSHDDIKSPRSIISRDADPALGIQLYSLGWIRFVYDGHVVFTHSGGMHAYGAEVIWIPQAKYGIVAFGNTAISSNAAESVLGWKLIADKLGISEEKQVDWAHKFHERQRQTDERFNNALNITFPDRPDPPLPPTLSTEQLVGTYQAVGQGSFTLHEEDHPDRPGEKILVADRPETVWKYRFILHHVSADYWIVWTDGIDSRDVFKTFWPGQFKIGVDGQVSGLEVEWNVGSGASEGKTSFRRVRE